MLLKTFFQNYCFIRANVWQIVKCDKIEGSEVGIIIDHHFWTFDFEAFTAADEIMLL